MVVSQIASLLLEPRLDSKSLVPIITSPSDLIRSLSALATSILKSLPTAPKRVDPVVLLSATVI